MGGLTIPQHNRDLSTEIHNTNARGYLISSFKSHFPRWRSNQKPSLGRLRGSIFRISGRSFPRRAPAEYPGDRLFPTLQSTVKTPLPYITKLLGSSIVGSEGSRCGPPPPITTPTGIKPTAKQHHEGAGLGGGQYGGVSEGGKGSGGGGPRSGGNPYSKTKSGGSMGRTPGGATARLDGGALDRVQREGWPTCGLRNPNRNRSWSALADDSRTFAVDETGFAITSVI